MQFDLCVRTPCYARNRENFMFTLDGAKRPFELAPCTFAIKMVYIKPHTGYALKSRPPKI